MAAQRVLLFAITALGLACAAQNTSWKTWADPERSPMDCSWYRIKGLSGDSEEDKIAHEGRCRIEEEWRAFVTERQACSTDRDCTLVPTRCPFGCDNIPVAAVHAKAVEDKGLQLWRKLFPSGRGCKARCEGPSRTVCDKKWCVAGR